MENYHSQLTHKVNSKNSRIFHCRRSLYLKLSAYQKSYVSSYLCYVMLSIYELCFWWSLTWHIDLNFSPVCVATDFNWGVYLFNSNFTTCRLFNLLQSVYIIVLKSCDCNLFLLAMVLKKLQTVYHKHHKLVFVRAYFQQ